MLLVNPNVPERVECGPENARRVYLVRPPTVYERVKWRRAVAAAGGRYHGPVALLAALADGVRALMGDSPDELRDAIISKIDAHRANMIAFGESARETGLQGGEQKMEEFAASGMAMAASGRALAVTESEVLSAYPAYAQMSADDQTYWEVAGIEAARLFLTGWEGIDAAFSRVASGASEETLGAIPEGDFASIGLFIDRMTRVTATQRKNSLSPASTRPAGETSTKSSRRTPKAGSPKATNGARRNLQ